MKKILYISNNDGSDTRIRKELKSFSTKYQVIFLGIAGAKNYLKEFGNIEQYLVKGSRKSIVTYIKLILKIIRIRLNTSNIAGCHVINEFNLFWALPFIWDTKVVLDIFDSFFLKNRFFNYSFIKSFFYFFPDLIIVTDSNRKNLIPAKLHSKCIIIPNYPNDSKLKSIKIFGSDKKTKICIYGSITKSRGKPFIDSLQKHNYNTNVELHVAGWLYDDFSNSLLQSKNTFYYNILEQNEALFLAANCDLILCLYEPNTMNNIYASPNKIYDAILLNKKVIINSEVLVSDFVKENNLGIIIENYYEPNIASFVLNIEKVLKQNNKIQNPKEYTWNYLESKLLHIYN